MECRDLLRNVLTRVSAKWVARLVGRKFCECCPRERARLGAAVTTPGRCELAIALGCGTDDVCTGAAGGGHLATLQWARAAGLPWSQDTCAVAILGGHLDVLRLLRASGCPWVEWACARAASGGHLQVLQWLRANEYEWDTAVCCNAARGGHLELLKWARANECEWGNLCVSFDADTGQPARSIEYGSESVLTSAATGGHLEVLQWLVSQGCCAEEGGTSTCTGAAAGGNLKLLQWARANGFDWHSGTCAAAARHGHFEMLLWARENGCEMDLHTCFCAAESGHLEMLKWTLAQDYGPEISDTQLVWAASSGGHIHVLEWLLDCGREWDGTRVSYIVGTRGHLEMLEWAVARGLELDWGECFQAAVDCRREELRSQRIEVMRWVWTRSTGEERATYMQWFVGEKLAWIESVLEDMGLRVGALPVMSAAEARERARAGPTFEAIERQIVAATDRGRSTAVVIGTVAPETLAVLHECGYQTHEEQRPLPCEPGGVVLTEPVLVVEW